MPICGIGGIRTAEDAAEFMIAGATAVQVGTESFADPNCGARLVDELAALGAELGVSRIADLVGTLETDFEPISPR